jgi:hypothetical protein
MKASLFVSAIFFTSLVLGAPLTAEQRIRRLEIRTQALEARLASVEALQSGTNENSWETKVNQIIEPLKYCQYISVNGYTSVRKDLSSDAQWIASLQAGDVLQITNPDAFAFIGQYLGPTPHGARVKVISSIRSPEKVGVEGFLPLRDFNYKACNVGAGFID